MRDIHSVLLVIVLLAGSLSPPVASAQDADNLRLRNTREDAPDFVLEQQYPPTLSRESWIPFTLGPSLFADGKDVRVTIRIYNSLGQAVAIPEALDHPSGEGTRVINLSFDAPGRKIAYWDGRDQAGRPLAAGLYYIQLVVGDEVGGTNKMVLDSPGRSRRRLIPW